MTHFLLKETTYAVYAQTNVSMFTYAFRKILEGAAKLLTG